VILVEAQTQTNIFELLAFDPNATHFSAREHLDHQGRDSGGGDGEWFDDESSIVAMVPQDLTQTLLSNIVGTITDSDVRGTSSAAAKITLPPARVATVPKFTLEDIRGQGPLQARDKKGRDLVDALGAPVNARGYLIDRKGNIINKKGTVIFRASEISE